jgi:hypothetical protein
MSSVVRTTRSSRITHQMSICRNVTEGSLHATFLLNVFDEVRRRIP